VMGFCAGDEYKLFMRQVNPVERMLIDDGILIVKFWFSIEFDIQAQRIQERLMSPLKRWKVSPVDLAAQEKWDDFTHYKRETFSKTHTVDCPWLIIKCDEREYTRIQAMRYILSLLNYDDKSPEIQKPDEQYIFPFKPYQAHKMVHAVLGKKVVRRAKLPTGSRCSARWRAAYSDSYRRTFFRATEAWAASAFAIST